MKPEEFLHKMSEVKPEELENLSKEELQQHADDAKIHNNVLKNRVKKYKRQLKRLNKAHATLMSNLHIVRPEHNNLLEYEHFLKFIANPKYPNNAILEANKQSPDKEDQELGFDTEQVKRYAAESHAYFKKIVNPLITKTHVFSISIKDKMNQERIEDFIPKINPILDLPFSTCFFEFEVDNQGSSIKYYKEAEKEEEAYDISGIWIHEITPGNYYIVLCERSFEEIAKGSILFTAHPMYDEEHQEEIPKILFMVQTILKETIYSKNNRWGQETGERIVRVQKKKGNKIESKKHIINKIVRIVPKKETDQTTPKIAKQVNWSHRWEVRGHWRRVKRIGKDRNGEYTIKGMTWVKDFVKGPKKAPLIKKLRTCEEKNDST